MAPDDDSFPFSPFFDIHADDPDVGRTLHGYRLLRLIGYGGMGKVFLAEQPELERRVAFKLARRCLRGEARRFFANEGKIHARLEHPNIATLYDAGIVEAPPDRISVDAERPFFAMEYVDGKPIDEYCQRHGLDMRQRLELFLVVCAAVSHAHHQPVVHLDLKPANIMVTRAGTPKLLDFGISRLLSSEPGPEPLEPDAEPGAMTFQYASPEQLRGEDVSVASDLYSLGMVLYKLLAGRPPYQPSTFADMDDLRRMICELEPAAPSAMTDTPELRRALTGDLDQIVLRALKKDPNERYGSVSELVDDIRRHLAHRPVRAVDGGFLYRTRKLVRRRRLAVFVSSLMSVLVIGAAVTTTVLWQRAASALVRAERASQFLEDLIRNAKPDQSRGEDLTVRQLLERGRERIPLDLDGEPELQIDMAGTFGEVLRELGHHRAAAELLEEALATARQHYGGDHVEVFKRLSNVGAMHLDHGRFALAERFCREALEMSQRLDIEASERFRTKSNLALALMSQGSFAAAEALYLDVLAGRRGLYTKGNPDYVHIATSHRKLGLLYHAWGRSEEAKAHLHKALAIRLDAYGADDTRVAAVLDLLGSVVAEEGRRDEAETLYLEALRIRQERLGDDHIGVAWTKKNLAALYLDEDPETARVLLGQALTVYARDLPGGWQEAETESLLGAVLLRQDRHALAAPCLLGSWETLRMTRGDSSIYTKRARRRLTELEEIRTVLRNDDFP